MINIRITFQKIRKALHFLRVWVLQDIAYFAPWIFRAPLQRMRGAKIGNGVWIGTGVLLDENYPEYITIEDGVNIGSGSKIVTHDAAYTMALAGEFSLPFRLAPVVIKKHAILTTNVIVLPGVTIGQSAVIGSGAVVVDDIPPRSVAVGVPAKVIGKLDDKILSFIRKSGFFKYHYYEEPKKLNEEDIQSITEKWLARKKC